MAFNSANFSNQGAVDFFSTTESQNQFVYTTTDTFATINADPNYFNSIADVARKRDYIITVANGVNGLLIVNSVGVNSFISFTQLV